MSMFLYWNGSDIKNREERKKMGSTFFNVTLVLSCIYVYLFDYRPVHLLKMKRCLCQPMSTGSGSSAQWSMMDSFT